MSIKIVKGSYSTIIDSSTLSANHTITFPDTSGTVMVSSGTGGNLLDMFYPVGTIYMSADANFNPNTSWGGTWVKIENRFLLGSSADKVVGTTGGEETHTLTTEEMPSHGHTQGDANISGYFKAGQNYLADTCTGAFSREVGWGVAHYADSKSDRTAGVYFDASQSWEGSTSKTGGDQAHNNMPPYEVVDIWKRTA